MFKYFWTFGILVSIMSMVQTAMAAVQTRFVDYNEGNTTLQGYLAVDDAPTGAMQGMAKRPGVLVVHEWMGLGDYARSRTEQLAALGYVAFAADIYGKGVRPADRTEAAAQAGLYRKDRALMRRRARAALDTLLAQPNVDPARIAVIGYCFGGGVALELARSGAPVAGAVSFHGNLDTPNAEDAKNIKGKILVLHGADDPAVPAEQLAAFHKEMKDAAVDWQLISYGGAVHSFTNPGAGNDPSKGNAYNAAADRRSWQAMRNFFDEIFAPTE